MIRKRSKWSLTWPARFIARWEGFLGTAYLDTIAEPDVLTIGYGHTGPDVYSGERISRAKALRLLARDSKYAAQAVHECVHVHLTVRQRMALISLVFNCGRAAIDGSTLQRYLNAGNYRAAADQFLEWSHANGAVIEGLLNRRKAERAMFLSKPRHHN